MRKKTGGRRQGTSNKQCKFDIYEDEIIDLLVNGNSQSKTIDLLNKKHSISLSKSGFSYYLKNTSIMKKVEDQIKEYKTIDIETKLYKRNNYYKFRKLKKENTQVLTYKVSLKTNKIFFRKYTITISKKLTEAIIKDKYYYEQLETILEDYELSLSDEEFRENIYNKILQLEQIVY